MKYGVTLQRVVVVIALAFNAFAMWLDWGSWLVLLPVGCTVWLIGMQVWLESRRVQDRRDHEAFRWELAETSGDPVLAVADYLDRQSHRDLKELGSWCRTHPHGPVPGEAVPDVVVGLFLLVNTMPKEHLP